MPYKPVGADENGHFPPRVQTALNATYAALDDMGMLRDIQVPERLQEEALEAIFAVRAKSAPNILDYGVTRGMSALQQREAIKATLDANPGKEFYFPDGDYRLDSELVITAGNSLLMHRNARFVAGTPMSSVVSVAYTGSGFAEDTGITGGLIDGALKANKLLTIQKVIHFTLAHTTFRDGINRGLHTVAGLGAELIAFDLRFYNTTATNVVDNIAIEANMGDSHFEHIIVRDWTVGAKDTSANRWDRFHPWISQDTQANPQMTNRYPTSIGMDITGPSDVTNTVTDTYRTGYKIRSNGTGYTAPPRFTNCRSMWAVDPMLTTALATAYPATIFDNTDGVGFYSNGLTATGHSNATAATLFTGPNTNLNIRNNGLIGYIKGEQGNTSDPMEYRGGIQQGSFTFTPTFTSSGGTGGTHTYTTQTGRMVVEKDEVTYYIRVKATLDATSNFQGTVRIGGIPFPPGSTNIRDAAGPVALASNIAAATGVIYGTSTSGGAPYVALQAPVTATGTTEIDIAGNSLRTKVVEVMITLRTTHYKTA